MKINGEWRQASRNETHNLRKMILYFLLKLLFYGSKLSNMERMIHSISKDKKKSSLIFSYNVVAQSDKLDHMFPVRVEKLPVSDVLDCSQSPYFSRGILETGMLRWSCHHLGL